jgi:hypothetical protein
MIFRRLSTRHLIATATALGALACGGSAWASENLTIPDGFAIEGDIFAAEVVLPRGASAFVKRRKAGSGGRVHIRANRIRIEGTLDATGSGGQGRDGQNGDGDGGGLIGAPGEPGGGGGMIGLGGRGTIYDPGAATCDPGGAGGPAVFSPFDLTTLLGSAGGAANVGQPGSAGSAGGGAIVLEAAEVVIAGEVLANGEDSSFAPNGVGSGAGSGGFIHIITASLQGSGRLSAHGGTAVAGTNIHGGGGAGGLVLIHAADDAADLDIDVQGGTSGEAGICASVGAGESGQVESEALPGGCLDADGDGRNAAFCDDGPSGGDCDDSDPAIHPGGDVPDVCDGQDNDCDGVIDAPLSDDACRPGQACVDGACVEDPGAGGGGGSGGSGAATPDHVDFAGGCAVGAPGPVFFPAAAALALGALARRRLRRQPAARPRS